MKNSIYDTGTEATLIEKFNSYSSPCEESNALLAYLWEKICHLSPGNAVNILLPVPISTMKISFRNVSLLSLTLFVPITLSVGN